MLLLSRGAAPDPAKGRVLWNPYGLISFYNKTLYECFVRPKWGPSPISLKNLLLNKFSRFFLTKDNDCG